MKSSGIMRRMCGTWLLALVCLLCTGTVGFAQAMPESLKLPAVLSDHMVVQRDVPFRAWGWAKPGDSVNVTLAGASGNATADAQGKWLVKLDKLPAADKPVEMTVKASTNSITVKDVLIGDVWVCGGQSNMAFSMSGEQNAKTELPQANIPQIRLFQVSSAAAGTPQADCQGQWVLCTPDSAKSFSAVGYYFGKAIQQSQKVPVGLIGSNLGATFAQVWLDLDAMKADADLKKAYVDPVASILADPAAAKAAHDQWLAEGGADYEKARKQWFSDRYIHQQKNEPFNTPSPTPPKPEPVYFNDAVKFPAVMFNARIYPLFNFTIKGAIWYQGESNGPFYAKLMAALIKNWRAGWQEGDFPFLIVQLPNKSAQQKSPAEAMGGWAGIRENQFRAHEMSPNSGIVVSIDLGSTQDPDENKNLHPAEKGNLGRRLALAARHYAYGEDIVFSGPVLEGAKAEGGKIRLSFKYVGDGLKIGVPPKDSLTPPPPTDELHGFAIAGSDKKFVPATAVIDGKNSVLVSSPSVKDPAFVRYGWQLSPVVNLYNSADLPAMPFRTDTDAGN